MKNPIIKRTFKRKQNNKLKSEIAIRPAYYCNNFLKGNNINNYYQQQTLFSNGSQHHIMIIKKIVIFLFIISNNNNIMYCNQNE